jgi:hypothetical protein
MQEDLDRAILTVETKCDLGPPGNIYDLSTIQFHGNREELRKLAEVIFNAAEQLKDPEEPAPSEYVAGDNHSALFEATDIEESLKYGG